MFSSSKIVLSDRHFNMLARYDPPPVYQRETLPVFSKFSLTRRCHILHCESLTDELQFGSNSRPGPVSRSLMVARLSTMPSPVFALEDSMILSEGPSCVFVGPVETAEKDRLEALYQQARDSYYNGNPLIVDDMFDKVEVRLRWYGSKLVSKYPRCSLKRLSVYADAEVDNSQVLALASVWMGFLAVGLVTALGPSTCALSKACEDAVRSFVFLRKSPFTSDIGLAANWSLMVAAGLVIGVPVAKAALGALQDLWRGDLVALKGCCPSCGEEVYAFLRAAYPRQKTECHVCEHPLIFHAKVEPSASRLGRPWAYGRVYLVRRSTDLAPPQEL